MKRLNSWLDPLVAEWANVMLGLFLCVALAIFLIHAFIAVFFPYSLDYGEAPLVDQAVRLANGQNIYRADISAAPFTISNYPPLYVLTLTPLVKLFGPSFFAGRAISLICSLASGVFLASIVYTFARDRTAAVTTAMLFLAIPFVVYWSPLARVDMLALALSTAGLYVLARWPVELRGIAFGAVLLVAAIYTRQSYALAAPAAALMWLWTHERRRAVEFAALAGGLTLALFVALNLVTQGGFFYNLVTANVNEFSVERLGDWLTELWKTAPILLILGGVFLFMAAIKRTSPWSLLLPYLVGGFASALTIGKIGSNANYLLELSAGLSLAVGVLIFWGRQHRWRFCALLLLVTVQVGGLISESLDRPVANLTFRTRDPRTLKELKEMVDAAPGPVLADEQMGMLTLGQRPLYMQPFEVTQLALAGRWDQTPILHSIEGQEFPLILIYQFPFSPLEDAQRWTPEMLSAIEAHYAPVKTMDGNVVYRPKGWQGTAEAPMPVQRAAFAPEGVEVGPRQRVGTALYVFDPNIAVNPLQPEHLAATVLKAADFACDPPDCKVNLLLYTSTDGGVTWLEQTPLDEFGRDFREGMTAFGPDGTLYTLGLHDRMGVNRAHADSPRLPYQMVATNTVSIPSAQVDLLPALRIDGRNGELLVAYTGRYRSNIGINLKRSADAGDAWTNAVSVAEGVPLSDWQAGQATAPLAPQLLLGEVNDLAVAWTWGSGFWQWPLGIWIANSVDGGMTFSEPRQIAETWNIVSAVSHDGAYHVFYRWGVEERQALAVTTSQDGGTTWSATSVSGDLPMHTDPFKAPGVNVAPNGTIDVVFYAQREEVSPCVFDVDEWRTALLGGSWVDMCVYDVYYVYSKDDGQTFSVPIRLNDEPIRGERFVRASGFSLAAFRLGMASTDLYAYPLWIETRSEEGTQAVTVRIER